MDNFFRVVEESEDLPATAAALVSRGIPYPMEALKALAQDLWGFLTLSHQGNARLWLNNTDVLEGFDVWRRVVKTIRNRSEVRRHELLTQLQRPTMATNLSDVPVALEKWHQALREYIEAGG